MSLLGTSYATRRVTHTPFLTEFRVMKINCSRSRLILKHLEINMKVGAEPQSRRSDK